MAHRFSSKNTVFGVRARARARVFRRAAAPKSSVFQKAKIILTPVRFPKNSPNAFLEIHDFLKCCCRGQVLAYEHMLKQWTKLLRDLVPTSKDSKNTSAHKKTLLGT